MGLEIYVLVSYVGALEGKYWGYHWGRNVCLRTI